MDEIMLYLPFPPTVNNYYSKGRGGVRFISAKGRLFREAVKEEVWEQNKAGKLEGRINMEVILFPPDRRVRDLDNYMKALLDSLTESGLWEDDSQIDQLCIYRGEIVKTGYCRVEINQGGPIIRSDVK